MNSLLKCRFLITSGTEYGQNVQRPRALKMSNGPSSEYPVTLVGLQWTLMGSSKSRSDELTVTLAAEGYLEQVTSCLPDTLRTLV